MEIGVGQRWLLGEYEGYEELKGEEVIVSNIIERAGYDLMVEVKFAYPKEGKPDSFIVGSAEKFINRGTLISLTL